MPFVVPLPEAEAAYPEFSFISALTASEQKAAFHVQDQNGSDLCLKIISPLYDINRLHREIAALRSIVHQNVARLVDYTFSATSQSSRHHIIEEFILGQDLTTAMPLGQAWDRAQVSDFFSALCDGLTELRQHGIVHRDLKPGNIRVRPDGSPVIIDFGLARHLQLPDLTNTNDGAAIGTPKYFAPEQFAGNKYDIDHRTDLFAVGILIYQSLVGQHPFYDPGMTLASLGDGVCNSNACLQVPDFMGLPKKWRIIVSRLLEKDRFRRPGEPSQVATILRQIRDV